MQFLDLTMATPEENLALDEALLLTAEADNRDEFLRVWESPIYMVVLGKNCRVEDDVRVEKCRADNVPILRRISGGGTVLVGPGCLNFSLVLRMDRDSRLNGVAESFAFILDRVLTAIRKIEPGADCAGTSDLVAENRKFSGNCQRRQRTCLLHHGTLLYDFDLGRIHSHLKEPRRRPAYRADREHLQFLTNLPATRSALTATLAGCWGAERPVTAVPELLVESLVREKYKNPAWVFRD